MSQFPCRRAEMAKFIVSPKNKAGQETGTTGTFWV